MIYLLFIFIYLSIGFFIFDYNCKKYAQVYFCIMGPSVEILVLWIFVWPLFIWPFLFPIHFCSIMNSIAHYYTENFGQDMSKVAKENQCIIIEGTSEEIQKQIESLIEIAKNVNKKEENKK